MESGGAWKISASARTLLHFSIAPLVVSPTSGLPSLGHCQALDVSSLWHERRMPRLWFCLGGMLDGHSVNWRRLKLLQTALATVAVVVVVAEVQHCSVVCLADPEFPAKKWKFGAHNVLIRYTVNAKTRKWKLCERRVLTRYTANATFRKWKLRERHVAS